MTWHRTRRSRATRMLQHPDDDPLAGVANLFDVAMVFAVALVVAWAAARAPSREQVDPDRRLDGFVESGARRAGNGERLGMAYRLEDGRIVYVPD